MLKGGRLLTVLGVRRPTRDADVLARGVAGEEVTGIAADDGMTFDASGVMTIREHAAYPRTRIVVPAPWVPPGCSFAWRSTSAIRPARRRYNTRPCSRTKRIVSLGYPVETVISRDDANTHERDYADALALSRIHPVGSATPSKRGSLTGARGSCRWPRPSKHSLPRGSETGERSWTARASPKCPRTSERPLKRCRRLWTPCFATIRNSSDGTRP